MGGTICACHRKNDQVAKGLIWLPYFYVNRILDCIVTAEEKIGQPPTTIDIFCEIKQRYPSIPVNNIFEGAAVLSTLFREDLIYTNASCEQYSAHRHDGFHSYSEMFR
jgi:hypothetical protein